MFRDGEQAKMRAKFHSLRDAEAAEAPAFASVVARAEARRATARPWSVAVLAIACAAVLAAAAPLFLIDATRDVPAPSPTAEALPSAAAPEPAEPEVKPVVATTPAEEPEVAPAKTQKRELRTVRRSSENRNRSARDCADC
jgi:hypothetical protein